MCPLWKYRTYWRIEKFLVRLLSAPELVSTATVGSSAKPREEKGVDPGAFQDLEELLDEAVPSGSKTGLNSFSGSKSSMRRDCGKGSTGKSRIGDKRIYSYDEIIKCREQLNDSDEFQFCIDDEEKDF